MEHQAPISKIIKNFLVVAVDHKTKLSALLRSLTHEAHLASGRGNPPQMWLYAQETLIHKAAVKDIFSGIREDASDAGSLPQPLQVLFSVGRKGSLLPLINIRHFMGWCI